jgi:hypothetical protein
MRNIDPSRLTDEELQEIQARRRRIVCAEQAEQLVAYCGSDELFGQEKPAAHHALLCDFLQQVERGEIDRLMIFMPPGSAKSTYTSVRFASWYLGRHPQDSIIQACHTAKLAQRFGRKVRNLVGSPAFNEVFPNVGLSGDNRDRGDWSTNYAGEYFAVGMDGALPGRRANGILIDDPIKGIKEADSETVRDNVWDTYVTDVRSRLKVGDERAWIVIINTRWHVDDPCGRILPEHWDHKSGYVTAKDGEQWYVLNLPMEAEEGDALDRRPGELLWPEWFGKRRDWLEREKAIQGPRRWNALYQGHPTTDEGAILKSSFWRKWPDKLAPVCE